MKREQKKKVFRFFFSQLKFYERHTGVGMLCDVCKKREATIHIKEVKDGKCISTNLCPECAREKELAGGLGAFGFNLAEVIFNVGKTPELKKSSAKDNAKEKTPQAAFWCQRK